MAAREGWVGLAVPYAIGGAAKVWVGTSVSYAITVAYVWIKGVAWHFFFV